MLHVIIIIGIASTGPRKSKNVIAVFKLYILIYVQWSDMPSSDMELASSSAAAIISIEWSVG